MRPEENRMPIFLIEKEGHTAFIVLVNSPQNYRCILGIKGQSYGTNRTQGGENGQALVKKRTKGINRDKKRVNGRIFPEIFGRSILHL